MTKEEIGQMAEQAGIKKCDCDPNCYLSICGMGSLTYFAKLVAAAEREAIATEFMERHEAVKHLNNYWHHAANYVRSRGQDV